MIRRIISINQTLCNGCGLCASACHEGAIGIKEGKVRDIAVISRVNRPVSFVITGFDRDSGGQTVALLSREKAQRRCMQNFVSSLSCGDKSGNAS